MHDETGTEFFEWTDHFVVSQNHERALREAGFVTEAADAPVHVTVLAHPHAMLPRVLVSLKGAPAGGGIANHKPATTKIANSLIAGNHDAGGKAPDCLGKLLSAGYNLIQYPAGCKIRGTLTGNITDKDPQLGPLAKNGGPTQTMALLAGSPAIDAANPAKPGSGTGACEVTDQRGTPRGVSGAGKTVCDIGAFEYSK